MRLNHDCVRDCMLYIESNLEINESINPSEVVSKLDYSEKDIFYSLNQLTKMKYIDSGVKFNYDVKGTLVNISTSNITDINPIGHEFLDNVRDNSTWNKIKTYAKKSASSVSLSTLSTAAGTVTKNLLGL
ncbi:DUF2513 domain-containing protein [Lactobacillus sp. S2-2]|uniref:DUF2513 domain-containing protein n=1 Tax=Lactobacillus sp. S2-2 TaxID=2692917 RepID=UPI00210278A2|nr:DUF2513 domain-containing protein [Lactobacillus sp. S2-2]